MKNKIPTAEEVLKSNKIGSGVGTQGQVFYNKMNKAMIEFAKLHVKAALEATYDLHRFEGWTNSTDEAVKKDLFVRNAYPENLIK